VDSETNTSPLLANGKSGPGHVYWFAGNLCAFAAGVLTRLLLATPQQNPVLQNLGGPLAPRLVHYVFHPLVYAVVIFLFVFRIFQMKFVGFWSVFFSFIVGGMSATLFLVLW